MLISGWFIGLLQENIGYRHFFLLVFLLGIVCFISAYFIPVTEETGRQRLQQYKPDAV
jgi:putative ampG protein